MITKISHFQPRVSLRAALLASSALACLVIAAGQAIAADAPVPTAKVTAPDNGVLAQPQRVETVLTADGNQATFDRAGKARDALGFPVGTKRAGKHVKDGFVRSEYDEVDELDSAGRPVSLTEFDASGHLTAAVRFDRPSVIATKLPREAAGRSAQKALAAAGVPAVGAAQVDPDTSSGGWTVAWARTIGNVPVRGDETRVHLWADGRVESVAHVEHATAAEPATRIAPAAARIVASRTATSWFSARGSGFEVLAVDLQWVSANAAFDPKGSADPQAPYRLAYVANVRPTGAASESLRLVSVFIDAADGSIIGGDVIE